MWLPLIDSFSKWPEVVEMTDTGATATICKLKHIFASHGLPEQILSGNSPQFTAKQFKDYCSSRGILHKTTASYHPRLNGEAERLVETFKNSIQKANPISRTEIQDCVTNFLAKYRGTPHSVTGQTSSELLNGRRLRTLLDLLHPSQTQLQQAKLRQEEQCNLKTRPREFKTGDLVWVCNYREGKRWVPGIIKEKSGNVMCQAVIEGQNLTWRRHASQLKTRLAVSHLVDPPQVSSQPGDSQTASSSQVADSQTDQVEQSTGTQSPLRRSARVPKPRRPWSPSNC